MESFIVIIADFSELSFSFSKPESLPELAAAAFYSLSSAPALFYSPGLSTGYVQAPAGISKGLKNVFNLNSEP